VDCAFREYFHRRDVEAVKLAANQPPQLQAVTAAQPCKLLWSLTTRTRTEAFWCLHGLDHVSVLIDYHARLGFARILSVWKFATQRGSRMISLQYDQSTNVHRSRSRADTS